MIVIACDQPVAVPCDLCCFVCREINTEAEEDLRALLQFIPFREFVNTELLATDSAFSAAVSERIQLRAHPALRAQEVTGVIALRGTHLLCEVRYQGVCIDNHVWKRKKAKCKQPL